MLSLNDRLCASARAQGRLSSRIRPFRAAVVVLLAAGLAASARADPVRGTCEVRFSGTSTFHDFEGTARCLPFSVPAGPGPGGRATVAAATAEVPVEGMATGIGARDRRMRSMLDAARFPTIRATVRDIEPAQLRREMRADPGGLAVIGIVLKIRDVERPIRAVASRLRESGGTATLDVEFPVSLREFGLTPPAVLGFVKVGDRVTVATTVRLEGVSTYWRSAGAGVTGGTSP